MTRQPMTVAVRDAIGPIALLADDFVSSYYNDDGDCFRWLADLRARMRQLDEDEKAER